MNCRLLQSSTLLSSGFGYVFVIAVHLMAINAAHAQDNGMDSTSTPLQVAAAPGNLSLDAAFAVDGLASSAIQTIQANANGDSVGVDSHSLDAIVDSASGNAGVLAVNAAVGNLNNQGSSASVAVSSAGGATYTTASATVGQYLVANRLTGRDQTQHAGIFGSLSDNSGTVSVNQAVGDGNHQANALAMALGLSAAGGFILADADLVQIGAANTVAESGVQRTATIGHSGNRASGIVSVNQASGNLISQANVVVFAAAGNVGKP